MLLNMSFIPTAQLDLKLNVMVLLNLNEEGKRAFSKIQQNQPMERRISTPTVEHNGPHKESGITA